MASRWYSGTAAIATFEINELLATKLRALYQRRKGRDLFDSATGLADERSYVEISGRDHAELVTDDRAALREPLEAVTGERVAALEAIGDERAKSLEAGKAGKLDAESAGERSPGWTVQTARKPKGVNRDMGL